MTDVLADPHRRAIANLSIPRSVFDLTHTLAVDEHSQTLSVDETHRLLEQLVAQGLVVNLGEHDDPARLAHQVERSEALTMPDEKAATYARRVAMPRQQWRLRGDTYMLTEPGLERLREPVAEARRFTTEELHSLVVEQAKHVQHDARFDGSIFDEQGGVLHDGDLALAAPGGYWLNPITGLMCPLPRLLPEEFRVWLGAVLDDHERAWGDGSAEKIRRAVGIAGGAGSYADATENLILDADRGGTAYTVTAPTFISLSILAYTDADTGTTIEDGSHKPTYTGYAAKSVASADWNAASAGSRTNANALIYAACTAGSSIIVGMARSTASASGTIIRYSTTASTTVSTTQTPPQFAASAIIDTLD
jgi:hypothetical protein